MNEEDTNEDEDVFDEDLVRELGLDPADLQGPTVKKERRHASSAARASLDDIAKPAAEAGSIQPPTVQAPQPKPVPPKPPLPKMPPPKPPIPQQRADLSQPKKEEPAPDDEYAIEMSKDIPVQLVAVIAKKSARLKDLLDLKRGEVVEFKKLAADPIDLVANGKLVAKAELVLVDGRVGARVVKLVK
ncbi:MAG: FliM/FliN family flagellar motor switch protein [Deltaproteobacteria bacterium]|nr:FliM/FliN family flagellar motor switch protein [Deltaproteobacteria bacterium]